MCCPQLDKVIYLSNRSFLKMDDPLRQDECNVHSKLKTKQTNLNDVPGLQRAITALHMNVQKARPRQVRYQQLLDANDHAHYLDFLDMTGQRNHSLMYGLQLKMLYKTC